MTAIQNRYDFVYLFDVTDGNPNGDPDAGNLPRLDPETSQGLVTDVCLKRKVRNFVQMMGRQGFEIFVQERRPLNPLIAEACDENDLPSYKRENGGWDTNQAKRRSQEDVGVLQSWLCGKYFDIRAFGGVLSTGPNAGQVRGPVQFTFGRSLEPIMPVEVSITRVADVDKEEGEMGRKHIVPYGLYRSHGYVSAPVAARTAFSEEDVELLWTALEQMFEHDRAAARGEMAARRLVVFRHESPLGNAAAHKLFERVRVRRVRGDERYELGDPGTDGLPPARSWSDYHVNVDSDGLPAGVEILERI